MSSNAFPTGLTHHISKGVTLRTSCARYECMGILYHELVAFITTAKDDWDFCFWWLKVLSKPMRESIPLRFHLEVLKSPLKVQKNW
ncbi:hypothetical protein EC561_03630 [Helicobacter pylori]|nr:hypothetical protein EC561_03630 [Helicobacter pylori]